MLNEIKVGEYIRTEDGVIAQITQNLGKDPYFHNYYYYAIDKSYTMPGCYAACRIYEDLIKNHSKNILDLIEVGDYVNGYMVDEFDDVEGNLYLGFPIYDDALMDCISEFRPLETVEIKEILTKEMYEQNCYKVVE